MNISDLLQSQDAHSLYDAAILFVITFAANSVRKIYHTVNNSLSALAADSKTRRDMLTTLQSIDRRTAQTESLLQSMVREAKLSNRTEKG